MEALPRIMIEAVLTFLLVGSVLYFVAMTLLFLLVRALGVEILDPSACPAIAERWRFQFSLASLFEWTTALAVLLGVFHYLPMQGLLRVLSQSEAVVCIAGNSLIVFGAIWAILGTRYPLVRYLMLVLGCGIPVVISVLMDAPFWEAFLLFVTEAVWITGSLWLVRAAGYRLLWRRRITL